MRISEIINEEINSDILNPQFQHEAEIGNYLCRSSVIDQANNPILYIQCYAWMPRKQDYMRVGYAKFSIVNDSLVSDVTQVLQKYQGKGIASTMYAYAKMLGNDIMPSPEQTDQGKEMWDKWYDSGDAQHIVPSGFKRPATPQ